MNLSAKIRRSGLLVATSLLLAPALANPELLPADTVFALGIRDATANADKLQPFIDEWNRLELSEHLALLLDSSDAGELIDDDLLDQDLPELDPLELLGDSAWLSVSLSATNPVPHVTLTLRPTGEARAAVADMLASLESDPDTMELQEGDQVFWVTRLDDELTEGTVDTVSVSLTDDLLVVSSNPDVLRGVLRRQAGASEPSLATSDTFTRAGAYTDGHVVMFLDVNVVASTLSSFARPFAQEFGVGSLVDELVSALETVGTIAGSTTFTDDGIHSHGLQLVGDSNSTIRSLLLDRNPATTDVLGYAPASAVTISSGFSNPVGWWNYLNQVLSSNPELGIGSLDELLLGFLGLDIRAGFFNWVGNELTTITTGLPDAVAPGVTPDNLLGESLYILRTDDEQAAQIGLNNMLSMLSMLVSSFTSLDGSTAGQLDTGTREDINGVSVTTFDLSDGIIISYAVVDGHVLIATDATSVAAALQANAAGGQAPATLARMLDNVAPGAVAFTVNDAEALLRSLGTQMPAQLELLAGLSGQGVDFAALDAATDGLEQYLNFIADRAGGNWSATVIDGNAIITEGFAEIDW